jgi:hypothetical protein
MWMCRRCGEEYLYGTVEMHVRWFHPELLETTKEVSDGHQAR